MSIECLPELVKNRLGELIAVCREFGIERLELFGSAVNGEFDPMTSDIDFLVSYPPEIDLGPWMSRHFALKERLIEVFRRPVDSIIDQEFRNPYLSASIAASRTTIYESEDAQIAS